MSAKKKKFLFVDIPFSSEGHILRSLEEFGRESEEDYVVTYGERFYTTKRNLSDLPNRLVFSIVRNPWERSSFRYISTKSGNEYLANQTLIESIHEEKPLEYYISSKKYHYFPRVSDTNDINYLMRYETLAIDFSRVATVLGISGKLKTKPEYPKDESWKQHFCTNAFKAVQKKHHFEITVGGYVF